MSSTPWTKQTREELIESFKRFAEVSLKYVGRKPPCLGEGGWSEDNDDDTDQEECSEDEDSNYDGFGGVFFRHYDDDKSESDENYNVSDDDHKESEDDHEESEDDDDGSVVLLEQDQHDVTPYPNQQCCNED